MSFTCLSAGGTTLVLDNAPKIVNRHNEGGPVTASGYSISGDAIVTHFPQVTDRRVVRLRFEALTATQASNLRTILDGTDPITVRLISGGGTFSAAAVDSEFSGVHGAFPDSAPSRLQYEAAEVELVRL